MRCRSHHATCRPVLRARNVSRVRASRVFAAIAAPSRRAEPEATFFNDFLARVHARARKIGPQCGALCLSRAAQNGLLFIVGGGPPYFKSSPDLRLPDVRRSCVTSVTDVGPRAWFIFHCGPWPRRLIPLARFRGPGRSSNLRPGLAAPALCPFPLTPDMTAGSRLIARRPGTPAPLFCSPAACASAAPPPTAPITTSVGLLIMFNSNVSST